MKIKHKFAFFFLTTIAVLLFLILFPYGITSAVLDPKGLIALKEKDLIYIATLMMLIVVIPVFILTFVICLRYRASNKKAEYNPNWDNDHLAEAVWWGFPCLIVLLLSILTWTSSHELDPWRPLESNIKPIRIQVVALDWKWLFIYPEQEIASVNFFQFPEQIPLSFDITADAPMNSFWIPQLGGQIYAMPGMSTQLNLIAHTTGDFRGSSANLSGVGFSGMVFTAKSTSLKEFEEWVKSVKASKNTLGPEEYKQLALPSEYNPVATFTLTDNTLYDQIVMKYMMPPSSNDQKIDEEGKDQDKVAQTKINATLPSK